MKLLLRHLGHGQFAVATTPDLRAAAKVPVGRAQWFEFKTPRSIRQNRFLHAIFTKAWENQRIDRWESAEHLKACALCAVGHCDVFRFDVGADDALRFINLLAGLIERVRGKGSYPLVSHAGDHIQVRVAKSWAFDNLTHEEATAILQPVLEWICSDQGPCPGTDPETLAFEARIEAA